MYASTKREFVSSPSTLFGSTVSRPGSSSCCDRSRSDSYIGCGNFGAAMIGSIGTMPVLVGGVAVAVLTHRDDRLRERHERAPRLDLQLQRRTDVLHREQRRRERVDADATRIHAREMRLRRRAEVTRRRIVDQRHGLRSDRDETPAVLPARCGSAAGRAVLPSTASAVTSRNSERTPGCGTRSRTTSNVAMSGNAGVMKLNASVGVERHHPARTRRPREPLRGDSPRDRTALACDTPHRRARRHAVASAVAASAPASVPVSPMAPTARSRASAGALTRSIASSLRFLK